MMADELCRRAAAASNDEARINLEIIKLYLSHYYRESRLRPRALHDLWCEVYNDRRDMVMIGAPYRQRHAPLS